MINPDKLAKDEIYLLSINYEMFEDKTIKLFHKSDFLIFWCKFFCVFDKKYNYTQEVFPINSLPWIIDTIENDFWSYTHSSTGSESNTESTLIDGEEIGISSMMHCCSENLPGYAIWNRSRKNYISGVAPQRRDIPKYMLRDGLLDEFKKISTKLGLKAYSEV